VAVGWGRSSVDYAQVIGRIAVESQADGSSLGGRFGKFKRPCVAAGRHPSGGNDVETTAIWPHGAPRVGQTARRTREVTARDIERFTEISGDRNPLHYDEAAAAATRFGGIVVQGGVTSAILNAVVAEDLPGPGTVFLHVNWSFKAPVRPGDRITGEVVVTKVRDDKPITEMETRVVRSDGTVVLEGTAVCYTFPLQR
jgi:acyl dehydratase